MNMFMKKLLNAVLPDLQPDNHSDNETIVTPFRHIKYKEEKTPALFDTRPYLEFEQWNNDNNNN